MFTRLTSVTVALLALLPPATLAQTKPARGWHPAGANPELYEMGIDSTVSHGGKRSGFIRSKAAPDSTGWATWMQTFDAAPYRSGRVAFSAYLRTVDANHAVLWMRVDSKGRTLAIDNMDDRPVRGTTDWTPYTITLDVPAEGRDIALGVMLKGAGKAWIDDASVVPMPAAPPVTASAIIEGTVLDESKHPVKDALVAVSGQDFDPIATTRSDDAGRFEFRDLPPGDHALTVTAPGLEAGYVAKVPARIEITLRKAGWTIRGVVRDRDGRPMPGILVEASRFSELTGDTFCTFADDAGAYSVTLPADYRYLLTARADSFEVKRVTVQADQDRAADLTLEPIAGSPAPEGVVDWLRANAIPLQTVRAGSGFDDMEPLRRVVGDAHLVCLGEQTHGTREFFQLKHRMLDFLVERMGFTVFGIEATLPESFEVNRYVLTGEGDPAKDLQNLYFWTWDTQEVLEMIRWMRTYNADPSHVRKIKFYGFDMQFPEGAAKAALDYLQRVDPAQADSARADLASFAGGPSRFGGLPPERRNGIAATAGKVLAALDANRSAYSGRTTPEEWDLAREHARVLQQYIEMFTSPDAATVSLRDRDMAENIAWIMKREGPETKMVVWAHNGHVSTGEDQMEGARPMGSHLRQAFGTDMVNFGFAFNEGSFQAIDKDSGRKADLHPFTVGPAPEGSLERTLARAGHDIAAVDLRALPATGPVADWFAQPHGMRSIGALYSPTNAKDFLGKVRVTKDYDALLFVEKTTAAIPNEHADVVTSFNPAPVNLDFEAAGR